MTQVEHQIRATQRRLLYNAWFNQLCWSLAGAGGAMAGVTLADRFFGLELPLGIIGAGLGIAAIFTGSIWAWCLRASRETAAQYLDDAADLRERMSSSLHCQQADVQSEEPFAQAVVTDAERVSQRVSVRLFVPLKTPFSLVYSGMAITTALLLLLLPSGLLVSETSQAIAREDQTVRRTKAVVEKRMQQIKKIAQTNPALKDLMQKLEENDRATQAPLQKPAAVRHDAVKKIDKLSDQLRERQKSEQFDKLKQFKKMLRGIKAPGKNKTSVDKLTKALASGDFKSAQEQVKELKEKLATLKDPKDAEKLQAMQKQLSKLSKQLDKVAQNKKLQQKLEQAGIKKEDVERMLQKLTKKDLEQIRKQLEKNGMSQKDIDKLAKQMQQQQQAGELAKKMAQAMQQASDKAALGEMGEAVSQMEMAGDQLSEMEMLEQEMSQIDAMVAEAQSAANELSGQGSGDSGDGNGQGDSEGQGGMGTKPGKGRGGRADEQQTATRFKTHRQKVEMTKGRIIGQFLVDGQQVKGNVNSELVEIIRAEERDATDLIHRDRIPRQYRKAVKEYFKSVQPKPSDDDNSDGS